MTRRLRRNRLPEAVLGILAALAALGLAAPASCAATTSKSPSATSSAASSGTSSDTSKTPPVEGVAHASEVFKLPDDWRNSDGTFNQASIIAQQKKRVDVINKELKIAMKVSETKHYLLFSDASAAMTQTFTVWCEALYANLHRQFNIPPDEPVWDGKCILLLFATDNQFRDYYKLIEGAGTPKKSVAAYFLWEELVNSHDDPTPFPQLMHICIPATGTKSTPTLQHDFAHESTHAFFSLYRKPVKLPLWLNEGLAEYMSQLNDPSLRPDNIHFAKDYAATAMPLKMMFDDRNLFLTAEQYPVVTTMVECLESQGGPKLKQLIWNLKDGMKSDQALKAVYGVDTAGLEKIWREYVARQVVAAGRPKS